MARMRMRVTRWDPKGFINAIDGGLARRMEVAAAHVAADVKKSMVGGGSPHVPSRPGEPPRVDTGGLRRSVHHSVIVQNHTVRGFVIVSHPAARALELGYPPGNLLPRPYLRPALRRTQPAVVRILIGKPITGAYLSLGDIRAAQAQGFVARTSFGGGV